MIAPTLRVIQYFPHYNLRYGETALRQQYYTNHSTLKPGEVVVYINKRWDKLRAIAVRGMFTHNYENNQTYDPKLRLNELLISISQFFGFQMVASREMSRGYDKIRATRIKPPRKPRKVGE